MDQNLVFDIGLNNRNDAAYYLHLGYRVVGVEANPLLAEHCALRFAAEIDQGRMSIINAGVWKEPGVFPFYRNLLDDGWSCFEPEKGRKGGRWEEMPLACITRRGWWPSMAAPSSSKSISIAPAHISLELNSIDAIVERLIELGYTAFKFVDGETYRPTPPIFDHQFGWRASPEGFAVFSLGSESDRNSSPTVPR